ncbi:ferrochelatase [Vulgatibacter incomptus]|uniref:Ferrochelatase n=1 Tax=Vulgatibacter incomptus TaxID=1391653 RepID=A0A0K1PGY3_9BACT|nr:ferrochelatase [Vulgatibacter incomptus]AKU92379.1 Ferrochelatase, protoheme ferro-lyase [Vulgatibacter incomptus]
MPSSPHTAVVLMNLGGPASLDDVEPFLYNIFSDSDVIQLPLGFLWQKRFARKVARSRAPESREIYARIGGRSTIVEDTEAQGRALEQALGPGYRTYVAMRAWKPSTEETVERLVAAGATGVVALPMYPQRSRSTSGSSMRELRRVLKKRAPGLPLHEVCCFPETPGFLDGWAAAVREALSQIPEERRAAARVLFSAHGLPQKLIDSGDPYLRHVQATVRGVMARLPDGLPHVLAFQSRATRARWLEPATEDALESLAKEGVKDVIVVPIAFVTEHVETLYELDMLLREPAIAAGIEGYHRVRTPGASEALIGSLAERVRAARDAGADPLCSRPDGVACPIVR